MSSHDPDLFDGRPLTPHERELLEILAEEAAEVVQCVTKVLRFGLGNTWVRLGVKNDKALAMEVGDFLMMVKLCKNAGLINADHIAEGEERKAVRYARYRRFEPPCP